MTDSLFNSTHGALTFAFNYSSEQFAPSMLARMLVSAGLGSGRGLVGLDGAGQAGMVLSRVLSLPRLHALALAARYAPHGIPCACGSACCCGEKPAEVWATAIAEITELAVGQLSGRVTNYRLRRYLIMRFFGERATLSFVAERAQVKRDTAAEQYEKLAPWLRHEENAAFHAADEALKESGMVGTRISA